MKLTKRQSLALLVALSTRNASETVAVSEWVADELDDVELALRDELLKDEVDAFVDECDCGCCGSNADEDTDEDDKEDDDVPSPKCGTGCSGCCGDCDDEENVNSLSFPIKQFVGLNLKCVEYTPTGDDRDVLVKTTLVSHDGGEDVLFKVTLPSRNKKKSEVVLEGELVGICLSLEDDIVVFNVLCEGEPLSFVVASDPTASQIESHLDFQVDNNFAETLCVVEGYEDLFGLQA